MRRHLRCGRLAIATLATIGPIAAITLLSATARAEPSTASKSKVQAARSYVEAGLQAQKAHDYDTALILYTKAYELVPHPVLLFNMAQAHRLAGRFEQALALYHKYLDEDPRGSEARTARELVAEIEARMTVEARKREAARADEQARQAERSAPADDAAGVPGAPRADEARGAQRLQDGPGNDRPDDHAEQPPREPHDRVASATGESEVTAREPDHAGTAPPIAMRIGVGPSIARRNLSYAIRDGFSPGPPEVATTAAAARVEAEVYPFALADPASALGGLGLVVAYDKTLAFRLQSMLQQEQAPVDQSHYELGVRYRFGVGQAGVAIAIGLAYEHRQYLVDQSSLMVKLDVPDVAYQAIAPTLAARVPVAAAVALFAGIDGMLMLDSGPIGDPESYGRATVWGIAGAGGAELVIGKRIAIRVALEYSRIEHSFSGAGQRTERDGDPSMPEITGATDSSFGVAATIGLVF